MEKCLRDETPNHIENSECHILMEYSILVCVKCEVVYFECLSGGCRLM